MSSKNKKFNDQPFAYHEEIELEISTLTNLGLGLGRVSVENQKTKIENWVVMVPFALPGERVRARVFRNHKNFSEADFVAVLQPSPHRVTPRCPLFGRCGGCQYQHLAYTEQLEWKRRQVAELLKHLAGTEFEVAPVVASPREFGYRSKITPHFAAQGAAKSSPFTVQGSPLQNQLTENREPRTVNFPIGFLRLGSRFEIVDVPRCEIATEAINEKFTAVRAGARARAAAGEFARGATLLLREAGGVVTTDYDTIITEQVDGLKLRFLARDFFQNNPFILPAFANHVCAQAAAGGARFLVDAYCGSGLFALPRAPSSAWPGSRSARPRSYSRVKMPRPTASPTPYFKRAMPRRFLPGSIFRQATRWSLSTRRAVGATKVFSASFLPSARARSFTCRATRPRRCAT